MLKRITLRNETEIIERIWRALPTRAGKKAGNWLRIGVGDDAAAIRAVGRGTSASGDWVLSTDAFLEGIHFLPVVHPPEAVGYKALARATSDLAAMGAVPKFFLLGLALPSHRTGDWLDGFLKGMAQAARGFGMVLIGGDTSGFASTVINVTVGGQAVRGKKHGGQVLTRSGADPGDLIYVSGTLGAAQLGLELILHGSDGRARAPKIPRGRQWSRLLQPHLRPRVQIALGQWLAGDNPSKRQFASAAIDTSDGLSTDLTHICKKSCVGARIWSGRIPMVEIPTTLRLRGRNLDPLEFALHGGEDYQLLFTMPPAAASGLPKEFDGVRLTRIGEIVRLTSRRKKNSSCVELVDARGHINPLSARGWDPFASRGSKKRI